MKQYNQNILNNPKTKDLVTAFLAIKSNDEGLKFIRDLMTVEEIKEMADRWQIAKLLDSGETYRNISKRLNVSTTTVTRVASFLDNGLGGYRIILNKLLHHSANKAPLGKGLR